MMKGKKSLVRRNESDWRRLIVEFKQSGESAAVFCRRLGVQESTFKWWRWKLGAEGVADFGNRDWISFEVQSSKPRASFELSFPDGLRLSISEDFETAALERLLLVLGDRPC
jgi:hypothetical protein